jgi:integrase
MRPPSVPEQPVPVPTDDQIRALLASCDGREFVDRRDTAIIRLLLDTGCRRGEIVGLTTADASLDERDIVVVGKGSRVRIVPFGIKTAQVLGRCLRVRDRDRWADLPALWLAEKSRGALGADGIRADARVGRQQTRTWSIRVVTGPRAPVRRSDDASSPAARGRPATGRPDTPFERADV